MAKQRGVKHHVIIKLEDLNKMFQPGDVIPIPKGFLKNIQYLLSAHNVSIAEVEKDSAPSPMLNSNDDTETKPSMEFQVTNFNE